MMKLPKREQCTGCGGCAAVCPKDCIRMVADREGFLYPVVEESRCVDCKLCEKVCTAWEQPAVSGVVDCLAARNKDAQIRKDSSSGGVFTALAQRVLQAGGAVCGAVYNEKFGVEHRLAFTMEELASMRGAKYTQSHAGHCFRQLKQLLAQDRPVLFVGTPCQCAALRSYIGDHDRLLLVDMICHGVPSGSIWASYVQRRRELDADGQKIAQIDLREKSTGWSHYAYSVRIEYGNGKIYSVSQGQDPFMKGFVENLYLRPSCAHCAFKGVQRCSDLTLGDCWGIWDLRPEFDDNKGTSLVLVQSDKGRKMWDAICEQFDWVELKEEDAIRYNPSAVRASVPHEAREAFFSRLEAGEPVDVLIWDLLTPKTPRRSLVKRVYDRLFRR